MSQEHISEASQDELEGTEIAIVGMACRFPGAETPEDFWNHLKDGVETLTELSDDELFAAGVTREEMADPGYVRRASVIDHIEDFDARFFGYTPLEATIMDPQHRLFLECAWEVFERAGYDPAIYGQPVGVFTGAKTNTYLFNVVAQRAQFPSLDNFQIALGNDLSSMATRVSYKLNLRGPSYALHTACSTSLVAVHLACQSLLLDECSMAVAGGASINVPQRKGYPYVKGGILSPDGSCRTFDADAAGSNFGNGVGAVLLKRLEDALADGDPIHAVIRGSATNNDGAAKASFTAPGGEGQTAVLLEAMAAAGVEAEDISYVEAHGTATDLGDSIEMLALTEAFRASTERSGYCAIGSAKTNLGHLEAAAGIAGLIKTALALEQGHLPPSLNFDRPNPKIDFASSPFVVNTEGREWPRPEGRKRIAGVSSFGIGSTNVHVIVEEPPKAPATDPSRPWQLLMLSARVPEALDTMVESLGQRLADPPTGEAPELADVARTLAVGRRAFEHRRAVVVRDLDAAVASLADGEDGALVRQGQAERSGVGVAFLVPGLGEHHTDMGLGLYQREAVFRDTVDRAAAVLEPLLDVDIREVIYPRGTSAPEVSGDGGKPDLKAMLGRGNASRDAADSRLDRTLYAQPGLFVVEMALATLLRSRGVEPRSLIGYSLGEYVCACLAGVLSLEDALKLVARRAALIDALPAGGMLAVTLTEDEMAPWLERHGLSLAAVNGTTGCVAAGPLEALEALEKDLDAAQVMHRRLTTTHAFHSTMLEPAADELTALVSTFTLNPPSIPYVSNVTGTWITDAEATDPAYWARHMCQPVRFADGVGELLRGRDGVDDDALLEIGPGQSLSSFARLHGDYGKGRAVVSALRSRHGGDADAALFLAALGELWTRGVEIDAAAEFAGERRRRVTLPTYPFQRKRHWIDPDPETLARTAGRDVSELAVAQAGPVKIPDLERWLHRPVWSAAPLDTDGSKPSGTWMLLADDLGVARALTDRLTVAGAGVVTVRPGDGFRRLADGHYEIAPASADDVEALLRDLGPHRRPSRLVHLWNVAEVDGARADEDTFRAAQELGFYSLIALMQGFGRQKALSGLEIDVVAHGIEEITGDEPLAPERSTLLGAAVVIPQEHPNVLCRVVDVDLPPAADWDPAAVDTATAADRLLRELTSGADDGLVAWRGDDRLLRSFEPMAMPAAEDAFDFRDGGVYLITGGLGGIGLSLAEALTERHNAKLVLTRRTPLPERDTWAQWLEQDAAAEESDTRTRQAIERVLALEASGGEVLVAAADIADEDAMRQVVDAAVERFGTIHGVIHAAGVLAEDSFKTVQLTGRDEIELHFGPKVYGLYVLERVLEGIELDFCTLYSSLSAILGGLGYVGYGTANLFMDYFALRHNQQGRGVWQSVDWDSWHYVEDEEARGGLGTTLSELAMTPSEGVETLRRVLAVDAPRRLVISTGELQPRLDQWVSMRQLRAATEAAAEGDGGATRARRASKSLSAGEELEAEIAAIWTRVLGVDDVGREENFFDLGGNSLLGMQLIAELGRDLGVEVEPVALFESPTVAAMARYVAPEGDEDNAPKKRMRRRAEGSDIAVIGMHGRFPGAGSIEEFWDNLANGRETISFFTDDELRRAGVDAKTLADPQYVKARPILDGVDLFDAPFFGYTPREAEIMDPQHRIFLESAWAACEDAGYDIQSYDGPVGVYAGASISSYMANIYSNPELVESVGTFQTLIGNEKDSLTTKASYKLDLRGPSLAVQTFCSTSLVATHLACQALINGECDMALAGGVSVIVPQVSGYRYEQGGIGSIDGHIRAFDAKGSGIVFGNGLGTVVLKRLDDALADGDPIRAVIKGTAINNDGSGKAGYSATSVEGQSEVVAAALEVAEVDPDTIGYMEAHGTGTPLGDPIEMAAINKAFRAHTDARQFCPIGSVKTNVGHLDRAAGVSGLIKTILALENAEIPPSLNFDEPNPAIDFEGNAFYVNTERTPWPSNGTPRRAGVNSLGLGGTNAHAVLEEAPALEPSSPGKPWQLLPLSARTPVALDRMSDQLAAHLGARGDQPLADVAYTLQIGRKAMGQRRVLVSDSHTDASAALAERRPATVATGAAADKPRLVFLFSGLGGHYVGMARDLYAEEPVFRASLDRSAERLETTLGVDVRTILMPAEEASDAKPSGGLDLKAMLGRGKAESGTGSRLDETAIAQPALFAVELALAELLMAWGLAPQAMMGYSLGEYVAATVGGMLTPEDALDIVAHRAQMIQGLEAGAMLAVPLEEEVVTSYLDGALSLAGVNGPQQSVVAGPIDAIDAFEAKLEAEGIVSRRLPTTHAFHSKMMESLYEPFVDFLKGFTFRAPSVPWVSNVTGTWIEAEDAMDPTYWARHMCHTVRFADGAEILAGARGTLPWADGELLLLEIGPGHTLGSLALQHPAFAEGTKPMVVSALRHGYEKRHDLAHLYASVGKLWTRGVEVDWLALHGDARRLRMRLPTYSFDHQSYWVDSQADGYSSVARMATSATAATADDGGLLYVPSWRRTLAPRTEAAAVLAESLPEGPWLLLAAPDDADGGVAVALAARLEACDRSVTLMTLGDASELGSFEPEAPTLHVVDLRSLGASTDDGLDAIRQLTERVSDNSLDLWLVSAASLEVSGDEPLDLGSATSSSALALARVLSREQPGVRCRALDVVPPSNGSVARVADRLLAEIAHPGDEQIVALRGNHRWAPTLEPWTVASDALDRHGVREDGVYLLTGGLRSRGFAFAEYLARHGDGVRLALVETPLDASADPQATALRERRLESLRVADADVLVIDAEPTDGAALAKALAAADDRWGALHGVIHAAEPMAVGAAYVTVGESGAEAAKVAGEALRTARMAGAQALDRALSEASMDGLDFALLVSSSAHVAGGLGLVHDATTGFFLDTFAAERRQQGGLPWTSVAWDFWLDDHDDAVQSAGLGVGNSGPRAEGAACSTLPGFTQTGDGAEHAAALQEAALEALLGRRGVALASSAALVATPRHLGSAWNRVEEPEAPVEGEAAAATEVGGFYPRPQLSTPLVAPSTETETKIAEVWESMLGVRPVGIHDGFLELGGDSLLAARLVARLREIFDLDLPVRLFFEAPTVEQLAVEVENRLAAKAEEDAADMADLMEMIDGLSEEEIEAELARRMAEETV